MISDLPFSAYQSRLRSQRPFGEIAIMLLRSTALLCALGATSVMFGGEVKRLTVGELSAGTRLEFSTADRVYRAEIADPATGQARLTASTDGVKFSEPLTVYLLGATQGRSPQAGGLMFVKMNQLQTGMCVEVGVGSLAEDARFLTEPIQRIRVE